MILSGLEKNQAILQKALDSYSMRWDVLSNNVANANTPNFKRSDVTFSAQMKRALDSEKQKPPFEAKKTDSKHLSFQKTLDYSTVEPKIQTEFYTSLSNNGNNVDRSFEASESLKTSLLYNATSDLLSRNYNLINDMIK